ncbi:MAG: twin-arginine translocase subunit TatC [Opitutales bacterium]
MTDDPPVPPPGEPPDSGEDGMSFLDHLEELRGVLFKSLIAFAIGVGVVVSLLGNVTDALNWPLVRGYGSVDLATQNLITTGVFEIFTVLLQVCFLGGLVLSFPFILYFVATFIAPALTPKEKGVLVPGCFAAFGLFLLGASFGYFLILPAAITISVKFNQLLETQLLWRAGDYYGSVVWLTLLVGAAFQFPLVVVLLAYLDIVTPQKLRDNRRLVFVIVLLTAALITPGGDPITLLLLAGPLYGLYEIAILVAERIVRRKPASPE